MIPPLVVIILVNWNGLADTLECLASLERDTYSNKRIIVVDNGSQDGSAPAICAQFPAVTVIETGANLGFTGGNNVGIQHALEHDADYIHLLNNDTTVEADALTQLVDAAEAHEEYGLLTPVIHYYDKPDEAWFASSKINLVDGTAVHDNSHVPSREDAPFSIPWASGCAMFFRAEILGQLNGFDDRYFLNWEDVDLSLRLRAQGHAIGVVPAARIFHKVGNSFALSGTGLYYYARNNLLLAVLHSNGSTGIIKFCIIKRHLREAARGIVYGRPQAKNNLAYTLRAIYDHHLQRYGPLPL